MDCVTILELLLQVSGLFRGVAIACATWHGHRGRLMPFGGAQRLVSERRPRIVMTSVFEADESGD